MKIQKDYIYKVYNSSGLYLGNFKNVRSNFGYNQNIGSAFVQIEVTLNQSEPDSLTVNDNLISIYEYSSYYPAGLLVFNGYIAKHKTIFGADNSMVVTCLSNGTDLNDYLVSGSPYVADQSQATQNGNLTVLDPNFRAGQTITTGAGITNMAKVDLFIGSTSNLDRTVVVTLWPSVAAANAGTGALGSVSQTVNTNAAGVVSFAFAAPIGVTANTQYFLTVSSPNGISIFINSTQPYAGGAFYYGGNPTYAVQPYDMYFVTYSSAGATAAVFASQDPTTMLNTIIDDYHTRGGAVNRAAGSTDATGLSLPYTFNEAIILEAVTVCLSMAPANWYWYVDPATNVIYFKHASSTADIKFIRGRHINTLEIEATKENIKNLAYFTGGDDGTGANLNVFVKTQVAKGSNRLGLVRLSDNRVKGATGVTVGGQINTNYINNNSSETYISTVTIQDGTIDTNLIKLGMMVAFEGFNDYVSNILVQVVGKQKNPDNVVLQLGSVPGRTSLAIAQLEAALTAVQTQANPTKPS